MPRNTDDTATTKQDPAATVPEPPEEQPEQALSTDSVKPSSTPPKPVKPADKPQSEVKGMNVTFEQNTSLHSQWPGGDFQARVPGFAPHFGDSYEEALESLKKGIEG